MNRASLAMSSPFVQGDEASGILLHVNSLPTRYGTGDLGPSAFAWVDRLARSGQSWWQALPLGPTGYGDSPYRPLSSATAGRSFGRGAGWRVARPATPLSTSSEDEDARRLRGGVETGEEHAMVSPPSPHATS